MLGLFVFIFPHGPKNITMIVENASGSDINCTVKTDLRVEHHDQRRPDILLRSARMCLAALNPCRIRQFLCNLIHVMN